MRRWPIVLAGSVCALAIVAFGGWWFWRDPTVFLGGVQLTYDVDVAHPIDDGERVLERTLINLGDPLVLVEARKLGRGGR